MKPIRILSVLMLALCWPLTASALTEPQEASPAVSTAIHTVRAGDSLDKIARANGCTATDLAAANNLQLEAILQLGQQLKLPATANAQTTPNEPDPNQAASTPADENAPSHTIKPGENLSVIAKQYGTTIDSLIAANPGVKPTALRPGQKIVLPPSVNTSRENLPAKETTNQAPTANEVPTAQGQPSEQNPPAVSTDEATTATPFSQQRTARTIATEREMTYGELAAQYGTETERLNSLNGLDLPPSAVVVKGADLLVPTSANP